MLLKRKNIYILIFVCFWINSCKHFQEILIFEINLEFEKNNKTSILFETKPGCSKTNFTFTDDYHALTTNWYDCFVASNINEYNYTIKKYFNMDFFNTIKSDYFNKNNLVVLVFSLNDEDYVKNGNFVKGDYNKYNFEIEVWDNGTPIIFRNKCSYFKVLVLEIEKV